MAKFIYVLSFSPMTTNPNPVQLHTFITQNRDIESWYAPFPGTYLLKSDKALSDLLQPFQNIFHPTNFIITWPSPGFMNGAQPPEVWNWVNTLSIEKIASS